MRAAFRSLKDHARARGIPFFLAFVTFRKFALQSDYLNRTGPTAQCLTVDRINNLRGYSARNIQPLTREANSIKKARQDAIRHRFGYQWQNQ